MIELKDSCGNQDNLLRTTSTHLAKFLSLKIKYFPQYDENLKSLNLSNLFLKFKSIDI
jgi:hypothetical protein